MAGCCGEARDETSQPQNRAAPNGQLAPIVQQPSAHPGLQAPLSFGPVQETSFLQPSIQSPPPAHQSLPSTDFGYLHGRSMSWSQQPGSPQPTLSQLASFTTAQTHATPSPPPTSYDGTTVNGNFNGNLSGYRPMSQYSLQSPSPVSNGPIAGSRMSTIPAAAEEGRMSVSFDFGAFYITGRLPPFL